MTKNIINLSKPKYDKKNQSVNTKIWSKQQPAQPPDDGAILQADWQEHCWLRQARQLCSGGLDAPILLFAAPEYLHLIKIYQGEGQTWCLSNTSRLYFTQKHIIRNILNFATCHNSVKYDKVHRSWIIFPLFSLLLKYICVYRGI